MLLPNHEMFAGRLAEGCRFWGLLCLYIETGLPFIA